MDSYISYCSFAQLVEYYSQYFRDSRALASESWSFTPYMPSEFSGPLMGPLSTHGPLGPLSGPLPAYGPLSFSSGALPSGPQAYQPLPLGPWTSGAPPLSSGASGPPTNLPLSLGPLSSTSGVLGPLSSGPLPSGPLSSSESSPESSTPEPPTAWLCANWPTLWDPRKPCDHCGTPTLKLLKTTGTDKLLCKPCRQYRSTHKKMRPLVKKSS